MAIDQFPLPPTTEAVATADATTNTYARDVIGNKTDAAVAAVGTTKSILAYVKGLITALVFPGADSTANLTVSDVIGNKTDAAQTTVGTTRSIIAYLKGLLGVTALTSTTSETGSFANGTPTTVLELVASSAAAIRRISFSGMVVSDAAGGSNVLVYILTGAGGSEATRSVCANVQMTSAVIRDAFSFFGQVQINLPVGTRVAMKFTESAGTVFVYGAYTIEEA